MGMVCYKPHVPPRVYSKGAAAASFHFVARVICVVFVGLVAMPVGLVKLILAHIKAKKIAETDGK
jgi:uncharacterized membrane protein